jgi:hypothetical protein
VTTTEAVGMAAEAVAVPEPPVTGDPSVDEVIQMLASGVTDPLDVRLAAFDRAHGVLQDRLADVEG